MKTDAVKRALELRDSLIKDGKILVVDFSDTLQGKDTSKVVDLMPNLATGEYVFRAKVNIKHIDPIAAGTYGVDYSDVSKMTDADIEDLVKRQEFDFPLWYKYEDGFEMKKVLDYNLPFIVQLAGCNFHDGSETGGCWYCFVDNKSNNGMPGPGKTYLDPEDAVDSMLSAAEDIKKIYKEKGADLDMKVFRFSGGEPTIALDWLLAVWRCIEKDGLDFVGQLDSNLSTAPVVERFERKGFYEPNILRKLADYPIKVLTALKGTDYYSLCSNVQSNTTMEIQKRSIKNFLNAGFDIYPQMYNPNPATLRSFLEDMDAIIGNFSMRIHIGPLKVYGPNSQRLRLEAESRGLSSKDFVRTHKEEWDSNYAQSCEIMDSYLRERYGVGYKDSVRSDVPLVLNFK